MAEIRLSKLTKQFSIGLARLVEFLNEKGANVEMNPNAKVSDEFLPAIEAKFGEDQKLKADSEKVTIKLKEIIEMGSKKKVVPEEESIEQEVVIKSNTLNAETPKVQPKEETVVEETPAPKEVAAEQPAPKEVTKEEPVIKVVDKIDLSKFEKKPAKEEKPQPAPAPTPAEKPAEPVKVEEQPKAEPREVKIEVEKLAGPKVVDRCF